MSRPGRLDLHWSPPGLSLRPFPGTQRATPSHRCEQKSHCASDSVIQALGPQPGAGQIQLPQSLPHDAGGGGVGVRWKCRV